MGVGPRWVGIALLALAFAVTDAPAAEPARAAEGDPARLFAVQVRTGPSWDPAKPPQEQAEFRAHSDHLRALRAAGHIVLGARYSDVGLLVFTARSATDVESLMREDPSMRAGTFVFEVHPFDVFYPGAVESTPRR